MFIDSLHVTTSNLIVYIICNGLVSCPGQLIPAFSILHAEERQKAGNGALDVANDG